MRQWLTTAICVSAVFGGTIAAQDRPIVIENARVLTMSGPPLEGATVVLRDGKIEAVGKRIEVPAGAQVVDAAGGTLMPGLVHAFSRAGFASTAAQPSEPRSRRRRWRSRGERTSGPSAENEAASKVVEELYARQDVFGELLGVGVTTLAVTPDGKGFPGMGAVLDPAGKDADGLVVNDAAFVLVAPAMGTKNKKLLEEAFAQAKARIEERKKGGEKGKGEEEKGKGQGEGEGEKGKGTEKEPDPDIEVLADLLEGKRRALLDLDSATTVLHFLAATEGVDIPRRAIVVRSHSNSSGRIDEVLDRLTPLQAPILLPLSLTTEQYGRAIVNPAATLTAAGWEVGFLLGDKRSDVQNVFFELIELVRHGLAPEAALAGVTSVPATALGLDKKVGTIAQGKVADLLLFDRDPLDPAARLQRVWHHGREVQENKP